MLYVLSCRRQNFRGVRRRLKLRGNGWPKNIPLLDLFYPVSVKSRPFLFCWYMPNLVALRHSVDISNGPKKSRCAAVPSFGIGPGWFLIIRPCPIWVSLANFIAVGQTIQSCTYGDTPKKNWWPGVRLSRSLKVKNNTDQSATYDFLLVIHSNYGPISNRFRDKRQLRSGKKTKKKHIFLHNVFNAPVESATFRTSLTAFGLKEKLKWWPYQRCKEFDNVYNRTDTIPSSDRRTAHGQNQYRVSTPTAGKKAMHGSFTHISRFIPRFYSAANARVHNFTLERNFNTARKYYDRLIRSYK